MVKINSVRALMKDNSIDLLVLGPGTHLRWLLGFSPPQDERPSMLLIGKEREIFLIPSVNAEDVRRKTDIKINVWKDESGPDQALKEAQAPAPQTMGALQAAARRHSCTSGPRPNLFLTLPPT